jgi:hypothetical protein
MTAENILSDITAKLEEAMDTVKETMTEAADALAGMVGLAENEVTEDDADMSEDDIEDMDDEDMDDDEDEDEADDAEAEEAKEETATA